MIHRLIATIIKEMLSLLRDPQTRAALIGAPLLQLLIFSYAATMDVRNINIAVINDDAGRWSQEFIARVQASSFVNKLVTVGDMEELTELIESRKVLLGMRFQADYSRNINADKPAVLQLLIDGRRANAGQISSGYLSTIAAQLGQELQQQRIDGRGRPVASVRHWFNQNLEFRWFIVPSVGAAQAMIIAFMMTSLAIARERELGTFDQLLVSPSTMIEIMIGKSIPALLGGMFVGTVVLVLAVFLFEIPFAGSIGWFFLSLFVFLFSVIGIGLTISTLCQTQQQAVLGTIFCTMPIMLVSGFITPVDNMPHWLQVGAELNPLKHFLVIVQGTYLKSMDGGQIWSNIWPMIVIGMVSIATAWLVLNRKLH
ncbi:MAG: ABC transporter permease [Halieaceae bacterium]|jgi:ABC-2 type transport system permease protein|nr:ABC transporter permease [Halieaceae bacterium]